MNRVPIGRLLLASVLLALVLGLLPLPPWLAALRPYWLALVVAYWLIETPEVVGLGFAFSVGLIADLVFGTVLGEQALRMLVLAFVLQHFRARLRFFPLSQQALVIGGLLLVDRIIAATIHALLGEPQWPWLFWLAPIVGMLLWPPLFLLLDGWRIGRRRGR